MSLKNLGLIVMCLGLLMGLTKTLAQNFKVAATPNLGYTPEPKITVEMFALDQLGRPIGLNCIQGDTRWGCTAFCNSTDEQGDLLDVCRPNDIIVTPIPYPYGSNPHPEIDLQTEYLPNVLAQEAGPSFEPSALEAIACHSILHLVVL